MSKENLNWAGWNVLIFAALGLAAIVGTAVGTFLDCSK